MALPGKLQGNIGVKCECGTTLNLEVLRSAAGYYLGYWCPNCGPYSRESNYYPDSETAQRELEAVRSGNCHTLRSEEFHPAPFIISCFD